MAGFYTSLDICSKYARLTTGAGIRGRINDELEEAMHTVKKEFQVIHRARTTAPWQVLVVPFNLALTSQEKKLNIKDMVDKLLEDSATRFEKGEKVLWLSTEKIPVEWLSEDAKSKMVSAGCHSKVAKTAKRYYAVAGCKRTML
jgi:hypothetical protein